MIACHIASVFSAAKAEALLCKTGRPLLSLWSLDLSRNAATQSDEGPKDEDLSAIPFQVTREAASQSFKDYHRGHLFFTKPSAGLQKMKEAFLPFWVTTATAAVKLHGAQLGTDTWVQRYNPQTRRYEPRLETVWQWVELQRASWEQHYSPTDEGMQVYAAYKYPRQEVNRIRPGVSMAAARPLRPEMLASAFDGSTRRVGMFEMKPSVSQRFVRDFIQGKEESRARELVRSSYRCDRVGQLRMSIDLQGIAASPVYVPVFIFRSTHFGTKLRTYVSGIRAAQVTGSRALDEARVGLAGAVLGGLIGVASGAFVTLSPWSIWVWGIALPATVAAFAARHYSQVRNRWNAYRQASERASQEAENEQAAWDPDWVQQYTRLFASRIRTSSRDPRGYYATMGVEPEASKDEIQAAYRGLVLKYHPDRVSEAEKQDALRKFQAVQEAYSVLRVAEKRRQYDTGSASVR